MPPPRRPHFPGKKKLPIRGMPPAPRSSAPAPVDTSWEKSAAWYDRLIGEKGSDLYQQVVIPQSLALLNPQQEESILDLGCGQGVFTRALATNGARVTGIDAAPSLIRKARSYHGPHPAEFHVRDAATLDGLGPFDAISAILCIQNIEHLATVATAATSVLKPGGRMLWTLNHPCFRIPRQTAWGFDEERKIQYRRIDSYASPNRIPIIMHPGQKNSENTFSFHRSLQDLLQTGFQAGLRLKALQEWHSHKQSQPGPRARAENRARSEFPLFLALLWEKPLPLTRPSAP
jgi:cyclopropane fatty-acyl-phospholipid synthase-like methyltransferase